MSAKANPTLIGAFVVGAAALAVILIVLLGAGRLFQDARHFVVVFDSSLHGLSVGAPVAFRGVPIGQVTAINPVFDAHDERLDTVNMIVTIELNRGQIRAAEGSELDTADFSDVELAEYFDEQGIRAQLALQSLLTGQLFVNLDLFPSSPLDKAELSTPYPQIATIETGLQRLGRTIDTLPLDQIVEKLTNTLDGFERIVNADEIPAILAAAGRTAASLERIVGRLERQLGPLVADLEKATEAAAAAMTQARTTLDLSQGPGAELVGNLARAAAAAERTLQEARSGVAEIEQLVAADSPERVRLRRALGEMTAAARAVRLLADYLERHPDALLQGKRR